MLTKLSNFARNQQKLLKNDEAKSPAANCTVKKSFNEKIARLHTLFAIPSLLNELIIKRRIKVKCVKI
jgi:hypothetical protein